MDKKNVEKGPKRLEELLLDDPARPVDGATHLGQEVRVVGGKRGSHFSSLIILFLFCFLVLGGGYFYLQSQTLPSATHVQHQYYVSPKLPVPARHETVSADMAAAAEPEEKVQSAEKTIEEKSVGITGTSIAQPSSLLTVTVGPLISDDEVKQAVERLKELGFQPEVTRGRGLVTMIRLLEGTYSPAVARIHLAQLKKNVKSAFLLPQGDRFSVFAGSFHQEKRARALQSDLAKKNVRVTLVDGEVDMDGTLLTVIQADQQTAREVADHLSGLGLKTSIREKK